MIGPSCATRLKTDRHRRGAQRDADRARRTPRGIPLPLTRLCQSGTEQFLVRIGCLGYALLGTCRGRFRVAADYSRIHRLLMIWQREHVDGGSTKKPVCARRWNETVIAVQPLREAKWDRRTLHGLSTASLSGCLLPPGSRSDSLACAFANCSAVDPVQL
jgi:hypothetical protein